MPARVLEGTWEEIRAHEAELAGWRLTVIIDGADAPESAPIHEHATAEEWSRAWREWADGHDRNTPLLSEEAMCRDSIYEGRG